MICPSIVTRLKYALGYLECSVIQGLSLSRPKPWSRAIIYDSMPKRENKSCTVACSTR